MSRFDDLIAASPTLGDDLAEAQAGPSVVPRSSPVPIVQRTRKADEHAEILSLAAETGTDPRVAEAAPEAVRERADVNRYDQLIEDSPGLAEWLADYDNAIVAQDDHGPLARIESAFRDMREGASIGWEQGSLQDPEHPGMQAAYARLLGDKTPENELQWREWKRQMQQAKAKPGAAANIGRIPAYGLRQAETYLREFSQGAAPAIGAGLLAGAAAPLAVPAIVPGALSAAGALGKANTALSSFQQNAVLAFDEFHDFRDEAGQPLPEDLARAAALAVGAINASLDMVGLTAVTGAVPKPAMTQEAVRAAMVRALTRPTFRKALLAAWQRAGRAMAVEGATEGTQELVQVFMGELAKGESGQVFKAPEAGQIIKRTLQAVGEGAAIAGTFAIPGQGAQVAIDVVDVRRGQARHEAMKKIGEAKKESKTAGRAPDRVSDYVSKVAAAQAGVDTVDIPAQKFTEYFQSVGADPEEAAGEMGVMAEAFRKARIEGGDITVPIAAYVEKVSGTPADDALLPHARIGDAPSFAEIEAERTRIMEIFAEAQDSAFGEGKSADPTDVAYRDIYGQILSSENAPRTAEIIATLWQERLRARAERLGVAPAEIWERQRVEIGRKLPEVLTNPNAEVIAEIDADLDRLRRGDVPSQTEIFGPTLAEFLMSKGGIRDEGGELSAMDADKAFARMRGIYGLVHSKGMRLSDAAELAAEKGYIDVDEHGKFDDNDVLEVLRDEIAGNPRRSRERGMGDAKAEKRESLLALAEFLDENSIDLSALTNAEARAAISEASKAQPAEREFFQKGDGYRNAPDSLMGFRRYGPQRGFAETKYRTVVPVRVTFDDGMSFVDAMNGLNKPHAMERARRNWPGAEIAEATQAELDAELESDRELRQDSGRVTRGKIRFGKDRKGRRLIRIELLKDANFSTFIHETGHAFLEEMAIDVALLREKDPATLTPQQQRYIADFEAMMRYLGADPASTDIPVAAHEKFAKSFEAYAREGKAPSAALQRAFKWFAKFLTRIYRTINGLGVELTPEVRAIMDRMLATDEAIEFAQNKLTASPISPEVAAQLGMTNEQYATYIERRLAARDAAAEALSIPAIREYFKRQSAQYRADREGIRAEVERETADLPVYRAILMFTRGRAPADGMTPFKIDRKEIVDRYGDPGWVNDVSGRRPNIPMRLIHLKAIAKQGERTHGLRTAAQVFGFASVDAMVSAIVEAKPFQEYVNAETDRRLAERTADPTRDAAVIDSAIREVIEDRAQAVLFEELSILQAGAGRRDSLMSAVKLSAQQAISGTVVGKLDPRAYLRQAERAATDFNRAMRDGDIELARAAKYRQIVMQALYKEAVHAKDEAKIATGILRDAARKKAFERLAKAGVQYVEGMKALLASVRLVTLSQNDLAIRARLRAFAQTVAESGEAITMSESTLAAVESARERTIQELTVAELRELRDDVRNLAHVAGRQAAMIRAGEAVALEEAITAVVERARAGKGGKGPPIAESFQSGGAAALSVLAQMGMSIKGAETLVEWLDGGAQGPWHQYFYDLANKAEYDRETMRERVLRPLIELTAGMKRTRRSELADLIQIDALGVELPRAVLISMALNFGTESNLDRVLKGGFRDPGRRNEVFPITQAAVDEITAKLNEADWQQIQTFWQTLEAIWPEIQAFQERMGGLVPPRLEGRTIQTPFGPVQGKYWPAVYDPTATRMGAKQEADTSTAVGQILGNHGRATTGHSFLFERSRAAGPLLYDYGAILSRHLDEVLTDLTHREFVIQATKLLSDPRVKTAVDDSIGVAGRKSLESMVARTIRADREIGDAANKGWNSALDFFRRNTIVAAMGFKLGIVAGNVILAPLQAASRLVGRERKLAFAAGIAQFYRHPVESMAFVRASSPMMAHRVQNIEHSYQTVMRDVAGKHDLLSGIQRIAMSVHLGGDMIVTPGIWLGEYRRALESGEAASHDEAVLLADAIIRQSQTAGAPKDLSAFEGQAWARRWGVTMFYGPMRIMGNRIMDAVGRRGVVKTWPEAFGVMLLAWILPAILWDAVTGKEVDDEDDDGSKVDDFAFRWAVVTAAYPGLTVPILRDAVNAAQRDALGEYSQPRLTPLADAISAVWRMGKTIKNETSDAIEGEGVEWDKVGKSILRGTGPLTGLPTGQLAVSGEFVYDVAAGEFEPEGVTDLWYLFKRRPEQE